MGLRKNRTGNSGNNKNKNKNKHENNKKNKHKKKLNLTRLSRGTGKMSKTYVGLSENSVPHCTQWFCWSLSLLNGYFIGGIPHFQTYPCCGREAGFFHGEMWQEEMSTMSAATLPCQVLRREAVPSGFRVFLTGVVTPSLYWPHVWLTKCGRVLFGKM